MMANIHDMRRKVQIAAAVLVGINLLAAGALAFFVFRGSDVLPSEFQSLHLQVQNRKSMIVAPQEIEKRVKEAHEQIRQFYSDRFPATSTAIFDTLGKAASDNHVRLNEAAYKLTDSEMPGLRLVEITAQLDGNYVDAVKFINALERDKTFFIVDSVSLGGGQKTGNVHLSVQIETYMRGEV